MSGSLRRAAMAASSLSRWVWVMVPFSKRLVTATSLSVLKRPLICINGERERFLGHSVFQLLILAPTEASVSVMA